MKKSFQTPYFDSLIDDFGIWQHTDGQVILRAEGYALDDAARGLLLTLALDEAKQSSVLMSYVVKSQAKDGFYGFANENRQFLPGIASNDATGQVIWAAGYAVSKGFQIDVARPMIDHAAKYLATTKYMRGFAYALLGAVYLDQDTARGYYDRLRSFFDDIADDWVWPEPTLTYGNGIMAYAFLRYALVYDDRPAFELGLRILNFVEDRCTHNRHRGPIGNDGWMSKGDQTAPAYSQQPIDAAYMIWAWLAVYQLSGDELDLKKAEAWMGWFEGDNVVGQRMYDPKDLRCYDGIDSWGVHHNSGAESNICLALSKYMLATQTTI